MNLSSPIVFDFQYHLTQQQGRGVITSGSRVLGGALIAQSTTAVTCEWTFFRRLAEGWGRTAAATAMLHLKCPK